MKLTLILEKHKELPSHPCSLSFSLGDNYLCQKNTIFITIRTETLKLGYTFSNEVNNDYIAFPMGQLESILDCKKIPYIDNVNPLIKLNLATKNSLEWDHVTDSLRPNYVFHESCHTLARAYDFKTHSAETIILKMLIEESFANTCEFFAIQHADESIHKLFLEVNSYFTVFNDRSLLKKLTLQYSAFKVFKLMLLTYLHSHFLNENINDESLNKILSLCDIQQNSDKKLFRSLCQNAFALNPRFRYTTTDMYLKLKGFNSSIKDALNFDYLRLIHSDENLKNMITHLSKLIGDRYV